ncbi:MAG: carbon storage regulator CsrA [Eubacteriales bacterium]|jgi:carbon storage regulator|nr:carbon storage regulator CsrA [Eubacteriales bacterium]
MLVLTRKKGEAILIGDGITVTVIESDGEKVKLGIDAPRNVSILRKELLVETINLNIESASSKKDILEKLEGI